jgi:hypothetical protein
VTVPVASAAEAIAHWHEFYLMAGTAAVTLVGLLFVALSLHLDTLLHDSRAHLVAHARQTLLSFTYVLFVSLLFLAPDTPVRVLGGTLVAFTVVMGGITMRLSGGAVLRSGAREMDALYRRRTLTMLLGYVICGACGAMMALTRNPYVAHYMIGGIFALLGNAAGASWDLLVQVGKLKRDKQGASN